MRSPRAALSALLTRWRIIHHHRQQVADARSTRDAQEHTERLEAGIKDSPRGPGAML